jgi:hypothetical protein
MTKTLSTFTKMPQKQRNLNISFKQKDISILQELKRRSIFDYVSTSGLTIDLIKKGMLYDKQQGTLNSNKTGIPL